MEFIWFGMKSSTFMDTMIHEGKGIPWLAEQLLGLELLGLWTLSIVRNSKS
jgi:hypothetical protein